MGTVTGGGLAGDLAGRLVADDDVENVAVARSRPISDAPAKGCHFRLSPPRCEVCNRARPDPEARADFTLQLVPSGHPRPGSLHGVRQVQDDIRFRRRDPVLEATPDRRPPSLPVLGAPSGPGDEVVAYQDPNPVAGEIDHVTANIGVPDEFALLFPGHRVGLARPANDRSLLDIDD